MPIIFDNTQSRLTNLDELVKPHPSRDKPDFKDEIDDFELFELDPDMAGPGTPAPFIKGEPDETPFMGQPNNDFDMNHQYQQHVSGQGNDMGGVNPSELNMTNSFFQNQFQPQNMSSSFMMGNSGIADDELMDLNTVQPNRHQEPYSQNQNGFNARAGNNAAHATISNFNNNNNAIQQGNSGQMFSHTPEGAPIQSPFVHGMNFNHFRQGMQSFPGQQGFHNGSIDMAGRPRPGMAQRQMSDSRSPRTPALTALQLGTPDTGSFPGQSMHSGRIGHHAHQRSLDTQWGDTPGSAGSYLDSPLASPGAGQLHRPPISEVLKSGQHGSTSTKMEPGVSTSAPAPSLQTQEAKRRRRRESHNMVERRRRDNINERIQDLANLVPQHRLEDEKVRKHLVNNAPLSPTVASTGLSPPQSSSLLANQARRVSGTITQGLPIEEKDRGPNKGDILNGSVAWMRDLIWLTRMKLEQEEELKEQLAQLGQPWPYKEGDDEKRMRSELTDALTKNDPEDFAYSRYDGSGLRVPRHTNIAGDPLPASPQSLSPGNPNNGSAPTQQQQWGHPFGSSSNSAGVAFKEEDEYNMEI